MSFLKFNNVKGCELVNHKGEQINSLAKVIIDLFEYDGLIETDLKIIGDDVNLKIFPWEVCSNNLPFKNGKYIIFCDKTNPLYIGNEKEKMPIKTKIGEQISNCNYESIVGKEKLNNIFQIFRFNKSLNNDVSKVENKLIFNYFENLCKKTQKVRNDKTLEYFIKKLQFITEYNDKNKINNLDEDIKAFSVKEIDEQKQIEKYKKNYDEKSFWNTIKKYGKKIGAKPLYATFLLYYALPKVSIFDKITIIGSLGYLISPFDLIPDIIPFVGLMDDIGVLMWAFYRIASNANNIDDEVNKKAKTKLKDIFDDLNDDEIDQLV